MRKADYLALANIIKHNAAEYQRGADQTNDPVLRASAQACREAVQDVARKFVRTASVDGAAFLKACGIG